MSNKKADVMEYIWIIIGSLIIAFSIKNLYEPIKLVTGGFSGLAIIAKSLFGIPLWVTNVVLNVPLFAIAIPTLGWKFIRKTVVATVVLSIGFAVIPEMNLVTDDMLLSSIFGGVIDGIGIGLVLMYRATTGGTDMLATLIQKKLRHRSVVDIMKVIDGLIVIMGISVFGIQKALYAIITIYVISKVSDSMVEGLKFSKQAFIISDSSQEIADAIMNTLDRGVTAVSARGMYSKMEKQMLFCVVSLKQIAVLKDIVRSIDPNAFVIVSDAREVLGEGFIEK